MTVDIASLDSPSDFNLKKVKIEVGGQLFVKWYDTVEVQSNTEHIIFDYLYQSGYYSYLY